MKISLKIKLVLMFLIFISLPLLGLGGYAYVTTENSLQLLARQSAGQLVGKTAEAINQTLSSADSIMQVISGNSAVAAAAAGDEAQRTALAAGLAAIQKENSGLLESLVVTDAAGREILSTAGNQGLENLSDRDYVKSALKGTAVKSEVTTSRISGKPVIVLAYPLLLDGQVKGTLLGTMKFDKVAENVSSLKLGAEGYGYLIAKSGLVICHPDNTKLLKENVNSTTNSQLKALLKNMETGKTGEGFYTDNGVKKFVSYAPAGSWELAVTADYNDFMAEAISIRRTTLILGGGAVVLALLLAYLFATRNIIKPVKDLERLMLKAGEGDLTVRARLKTKDEIQTLGDYFNKMIEDQARTISHVRQGAEELTSAAEDVSASAQEISASTEEIANRIQEVAANAEQQNSSIIETSKVLVQLSSLIQIAQAKASTAKENSGTTMDAARQGRRKVQGTVEAIENINKVTTETEHIMKELNELSRKVSGIIDVINEISAQTNLLALNAAIEAARAGEHGRGFTVVAEEVRQLSEQTNTGAQEIAALIQKMLVQIGKATESTASSQLAVEKGVHVAKETDQSFLNIISAVEQIAQDIEQIAEVTKDEVASSDQIVQIIDSVASITETTTGHTEEVSAAAEEQAAVVENLASRTVQTSNMAETLDELVEKFKIGGQEEI